MRSWLWLLWLSICLSLAQLFLLMCSYVKLSQVKNFFIPSKENVPHIKPQRQCTYVKDEHLRSTQQHVVSHTSQYTINTKHNNHYSHDTSSSLELSQSMPKLISATGSYWKGRIPVAISNFSGKFIGVLCTETVEATMPLAVESYRDVTTNL